MIGTTPLERMRMWRNWQTHETQNLAVVTSCGFKSHHPQEDEKSRYGALLRACFFSSSCGCLEPTGFPKGTRRAVHAVAVSPSARSARIACHWHAAPHHPQDARPFVTKKMPFVTEGLTSVCISLYNIIMLIENTSDYYILYFV